MSELPRLLLCSFDVIPAPTGSSRRLSEYLRGLADHFNVVVLSAKTPDHSHIEKFQGARLLRVPVGTGDFASRLQAFDRAVRRQLESEEYVVAHFTDAFGGYALCELKDSFGYKLVYEAQTFISQELRYTHPQLEGDRRFLAKVRRQELFCLMNAHRVICGSNVTRAYIRGLGVAPAQVEVLRSPVDLEPFSPEAMGEPDGVPMRLLYLGSQVGWQGLPTLLRAMQVALQKADVHLSIVGPSHPAWQPLLEDLVQELGIGEKVEFLPPVPHRDLHKVLAAADVGVAPLDDLDRNAGPGGPLSKVAEYLAAGRPVIASDLPMARDQLPEHATYFHAPGDPEDLGDCIVDLARDPALRVKMARTAREFARNHHDSNVIRARLRQIYQEIAGLRPAARAEGAEGDSAFTAYTQQASVGTPTGRIETLGARKSEVHDPGTDPAIPASLVQRATRRNRRRAREEAESGKGTDPAAPPAPVYESRQPTTEPAAPPPERPVVMGTPLREQPPVVEGTLLEEPPAEVRTTDKVPSLYGYEETKAPQPEPDTMDKPPPLPPAPPPADAHDDVDQPPEVDASLIEAVEDVEAVPEDIETADDAVLEADGDLLPDPPAPPATAPEAPEPPAAQPAAEEPPAEAEVVSTLDPWFAQLVHGYCPPEGAQFARPTPPTNFPGREGPPPATVQPPSAGPQSFPTRSGGG